MDGKTYDLFGFTADDLHDARAKVEGALQVKLGMYESGFNGGEHYRLGAPGGEHFILERNFYPSENIWTEPDHRDIKFLFAANETSRGARLEEILKAAIPGLKLIRRERI